MTDQPTIAILGATGHIGCSLVHAFAMRGDARILAYARRPDAVHTPSAGVTAHPIDTFGNHPADIVINCTGAGDPARIRAMGPDLFRLTAHFDSRVIGFIRSDPTRLYINMSSGAVYGTDFDAPANADSKVRRPVNDTDPARFYGIVKRHAEAWHRAEEGLNIVDIRVFNYVSSFLDLSGRLFIVDVVNALRKNHDLETDATDSVRDYASPGDLMAMIDAIADRWRAGADSVNAALDLYTRSPVAKFDLLRAVAAEFGLKWQISRDVDIVAATGTKSLYYSENRAAEAWGYRPERTAEEGVMSALSALLNPRAAGYETAEGKSENTQGSAA